MFNTIIIGPSKVGKTALVASLQQASNIIDALQSDLQIRTIPKNQRTREIFSQALDIVRKGDVPFAGTELSICYEFVLELETEPEGVWEHLESLWGGNKHEGLFQFMDAPGGAVFDPDLSASNANNPNFQALIEQMLNSQGLIVCIDANHALLKDPEKIANIQSFYLESFRFFLTHGYRISVPFRNICFILTKADLYAQSLGQTDDLEDFLANVDAFQLTRNIIGDKSLETLEVFLEEESNICFSTTSVFGFKDGKPHPFIGQSKEGMIHVDDWRPYNIAESFAFLLTGEPHHKAQRILSAAELNEKLKNNTI